MSGSVWLGVTVLGAYLIGAIPFGYLIARWRGVDILHQGSGNIGATNVGRVLGRKFGVLVFLLDFAKGAVPTALALTINPADLPPQSLAVAAGLAAFLGHVFPIYLRFRGGKGVATATGVVAVLVPAPAVGAFLVWLAVLSATRYMSLASLSAAGVLCCFRLGLTPEPFAAEGRMLTWFCLVAAVLVALRHLGNVTRLLHGTENRLKDTPAMFATAKVIHVLALALWFGGGVFFTFIAAPVVFQTFQTPGADQEHWRPLLKDDDPKVGTRLAGAAVGPIFPWYFLLAGVCGLLAVIPALAWSWAEPGNGLHRTRSLVLILALVTVVIGWPLVQQVSALRAARYAADPAVAAAAQAAFSTWHLYSLLLNFVTLILVGVATALTAWLPVRSQPVPSAEAVSARPVAPMREPQPT